MIINSVTILWELITNQQSGKPFYCLPTNGYPTCHTNKTCQMTMMRLHYNIIITEAVRVSTNDKRLSHICQVSRYRQITMIVMFVEITDD